MYFLAIYCEMICCAILNFHGRPNIAQKQETGTAYLSGKIIPFHLKHALLQFWVGLLQFQ